MAVSQSRLLQAEFLQPRYWPTWAGIGLMRLICLLPLRARWQLGKALGLLAYRVAGRRRRIVETNISLCFPDMDKRSRHQLVVDNFRSSGISIIETATAWFISPMRYRDIVDIEGLEVLTEASKQGRGVMLLGMHLSTLDFCGAVLSTWSPFDVMYRYNKNRLLEAVMTRGRERNFSSAIERDDVKQVIRRLRKGATVWYGPDQDYGRKHSVFAPFFNRQAASITATARIARITGCRIVVFSHYRNLETGRYRICLEPLDTFPSDDDVRDCSVINQLVERAVRRDPAQYWWVHRRFKTRPEGEARLY
jgi:KDO2-lipid IV(A) lauroyltransferase